MFCKLALRNVRRSLRDYAVYFLTLTFGVCLFYVFNALDSQSAMEFLRAAETYLTEKVGLSAEQVTALLETITTQRAAAQPAA